MEQKTGLSDEGVPVTRSKTHMHVKDSMLQIWPWMYAIWSYSKFQPLSPDLKKGSGSGNKKMYKLPFSIPCELVRPAGCIHIRNTLADKNSERERERERETWWPVVFL